MKQSRRRFLRLAGAIAALPAVQRIASAQAYPTRPVTIVDTFPPGGSTAIIARIIADRFSKSLGQQVIVDQRAGAGGTVGARQIARSTPDGYTLMLGATGPLAIAPSLYANAGYDPRKQFAPIGLIAVAPSSLVVHPSFPVHSIPELIAYAKQNPGKVDFGSTDVGSLSHMAGALFTHMAGITLGHIPYRGTAAVITDLLGGHIPMGFAPVPTTAEHAKKGTLRMLGVTSSTRSSLLPDVPTIAEQNLPGYEAVLHYGLVAPTGTPRAVIEKLNRELRALLASEDIRGRFAVIGAEPLASTPEEYAAEIDREESKWSALVRSLGLKALD